jgi:hypothetical protein
MPPPPEDPPDWENDQAGSARFATNDPFMHAEEQPLAVGNQQSAIRSTQTVSGPLSIINGPMSVRSSIPAGRDPSSVVKGQSSAVSGQSTIYNRVPLEDQKSAILAVPPAPKVAASILPARIEAEHPPQMVTVTLRPTGDPQRDIRRISRLHGTFISYPGKDHFAFQIFEEGRGHLIEFPNDTTHVCADLLTILKEAVGEDNLRVEPIMFL